MAKELPTFLFACNSVGSEKLNLLNIRKSKNPQCFKNVNTLPVDYEAYKIHGLFENNGQSNAFLTLTYCDAVGQRCRLTLMTSNSTTSNFRRRPSTREEDSV
ncbi:Tigger transposable element-derived protein 6 [Thelohanellus kitauei]|uniref:Tigger transposable element-derived protein 6 n=1 Tax=Thelohanellus kitauei TaxID=669202 RepID=A0A0C2J9K4_THEKT|nr:Tigger transposable element-derived protein 6 [Thelohanellus kitauei]